MRSTFAERLIASLKCLVSEGIGVLAAESVSIWALALTPEVNGFTHSRAHKRLKPEDPALAQAIPEVPDRKCPKGRAGRPQGGNGAAKVASVGMKRGGMMRRCPA